MNESSAIDSKLLFLLLIGFLLIPFGAFFFNLGAPPFGPILMFLGAIVLGISIRLFWARVEAFESNSKHIHFKSYAHEKSRIRCSYCRKLYDKSNNYCPYCGGPS